MLFNITIVRLTTVRNTPGASSDLLYLLGNMPGLLGTVPPSDDSTASSMMGLMGMHATCRLYDVSLYDRIPRHWF